MTQVIIRWPGKTTMHSGQIHADICLLHTHAVTKKVVWNSINDVIKKKLLSSHHQSIEHTRTHTHTHTHIYIYIINEEAVNILNRFSNVYNTPMVGK